MGLTVTVLGASGSYPGPGQACSGYLVQGGGTTVWVDAGSGTMANLQRHVSLDEVDAIVLSHEHPDHWGDIHGAYIAAKYYLDLSRLSVYAPPGLSRHAYYTDRPLVWNDVRDGDAVDVGSIRLTFSRTDHGPETLAVRADCDGQSVGYSADSGPGWSLEALGPGLDLAVCEATLDKREEGRVQHMSARQAGRSAREAGVGQLVLTHLRPGLVPSTVAAEAAEAFGGSVQVAVEHEVYES